MGPRGKAGACAWDTDAVQGIISVVVNVLGKITILAGRNTDLVKYVSVADVVMLRSQRKLIMLLE